MNTLPADRSDRQRRGPLFTLGFNFDWALVDQIARLNDGSEYGFIEEVFGARPDSPMSSARPTSRIPQITYEQFAKQVAILNSLGVSFNYLMNTSEPPEGRLRTQAIDYLAKLLDIGIHRLTVGTPELALLVKRRLPQYHVTMSITRGVRTTRDLEEAALAGADACYLDGVFVNRNFGLLRSLLAVRAIECRLYANMSCISGCPVVRQHYDTFAGQQSSESMRRHNAFFAGCSLIKLRSAVEWIQMPWIRPEDVPRYVDNGVSCFKLSDRLAPTPVLAEIAEAYLTRRSPCDMFRMIDRDGSKFQKLVTGPVVMPFDAPISIRSSCIPANFIEHFIDGRCVSQDKSCRICREVAAAAVSIAAAWNDFEPSQDVLDSIPLPLRSRAARVGAC